MIVFTSNRELIKYFNNPMVYNLSSFYSGYINLSPMLTKIYSNTQFSAIDKNYIYSPIFDNTYANMLLNDKDMFRCLMHIMINAANNFNVIILISHDDYRDAVKESIIKFIQIRYGYNCWEIEDIDDLQVIDEPFFTPMGIMNLDNDKLRYDSIFGENHMLNKLHNQ